MLHIKLRYIPIMMKLIKSSIFTTKNIDSILIIYRLMGTSRWRSIQRFNQSPLLTIQIPTIDFIIYNSTFTIKKFPTKDENIIHRCHSHRKLTTRGWLRTERHLDRLGMREGFYFIKKNIYLP